MRIVLVAALLATALVGPSLAHQSGSATNPSSQPNVFLMSGHPARDGRIIAVTRLDASATAEMQAATHGEVRVGTQGFVFAIARIAAEGRQVGTTLVTVNGSTKSMTEVAAQLRAAALGPATLVVFADGRRREGVVKVLLTGGQLHARSRVDLKGVTYVTVLSNGREETFAIVSSGETAAAIIVAAEAGGGIGVGADDGARGLLDVISGLRP